MHYVGTVDWTFVAEPAPASATSEGLARRVIVGPDQGAVHTELALGDFAPGGWLARHIHSFEESLYVLEGELVLEIDGHVHRLVRGDFALIPIGARHALANPGDAHVRWLGFNTPQRLDASGSRRDTFFESAPLDYEALLGSATRPSFGHATLRYVGHYDGTPPQAEALAVKDPALGRAPAGMDTALLAYSGISVKMLIDRVFGADLLTMFTVDYEPGGAAQAHDHPFEEAYFFLAGEIDAEIDDQRYRLGPGHVVFAGVGSVHGFYNDGADRVRWIETQAPQPPTRHSYRWFQSWKRYEEGA